jgi:hypothetical protein
MLSCSSCRLNDTLQQRVPNATLERAQNSLQEKGRVDFLRWYPHIAEDDIRR